MIIGIVIIKDNNKKNGFDRNACYNVNTLK